MQCTYVKESGLRCGAQAMKNSQYCFVHSPTTKEQHLEAAAKGGSLSSRKDKLDLPPITVDRPHDVIPILVETINSVRDGSLSPNVANTIGFLCSHLLKAFEISKLDQQLEAIEHVILQRRIIKRGGGNNENA